MLDGVELRPIAAPSRNPLALIKSRLPQRKSTALVRVDDVPLATKLMAAAPVVIAAASKAIEVYQAYNKTKHALTKPTATPNTMQNKPIVVSAQNHAPVTGILRYTYIRSVHITTRDE
ncbi:MAG TPA: hypothetical protein ENJ56_01310 [Anaerolineae bacterium]|nr:hypothetical protein [Anaerolineae bacterium]